MALRSRPLFVGFSSACRTGREGGDLEVTVQTASGPRTFLLPWFFVREVDAMLERWRREAHEAVLLTMHDGVLGETLREAARAGGQRDVTFLLASGADVNHRAHYYSPLACAARNGHLAVVTALLDAGADGLGVALLKACSGGQHSRRSASPGPRSRLCLLFWRDAAGGCSTWRPPGVRAFPVGPRC